MLIVTYKSYIKQTTKQFTSEHNYIISKQLIHYTIKRYIYTLLFYLIYYTYKLSNSSYNIYTSNNIQYTLNYIINYRKKINNIAH